MILAFREENSALIRPISALTVLYLTWGQFTMPLKGNAKGYFQKPPFFYNREFHSLLHSNKLKLSYAQAPPKTELWHHKIKPPAAAPRLLNRGAVFGLPHKPRGQHFALHPEWPIA